MLKHPSGIFSKIEDSFGSSIHHFPCLHMTDLILQRNSAASPDGAVDARFGPAEHWTSGAAQSDFVVALLPEGETVPLHLNPG